MLWNGLCGVLGIVFFGGVEVLICGLFSKLLVFISVMFGGRL